MKERKISVCPAHSSSESLSNKISINGPLNQEVIETSSLINVLMNAIN